jgi:hypothetical protein
MSVRRSGVGGVDQPDNGREKPRRQRLGRLLLLSLGGGGIAGILAFIIIWIPTVYALANTSTSVPKLAAKTLFPSPTAVHKTVDVYDPPVYRPAAPTSQPTSPPSASPLPTPSRSPRPTPSGSPRPTPTDN